MAKQLTNPNYIERYIKYSEKTGDPIGIHYFTMNVPNAPIFLATRVYNHNEIEVVGWSSDGHRCDTTITQQDLSKKIWIRVSRDGDHLPELQEGERVPATKYFFQD